MWPGSGLVAEQLTELILVKHLDGKNHGREAAKQHAEHEYAADRKPRAPQPLCSIVPCRHVWRNFLHHGFSCGRVLSLDWPAWRPRLGSPAAGRFAARPSVQASLILFDAG